MPQDKKPIWIAAAMSTHKSGFWTFDVLEVNSKHIITDEIQEILICFTVNFTFFSKNVKNTLLINFSYTLFTREQNWDVLNGELIN